MNFDLPWPPTNNHYFTVVRGRKILSRQGRDYRERVKVLLFGDRGSYRSTDRLRVGIAAFPPDRRKRDLDNLPKAILDALQHAEVIPDDSQIDELTIRRCSKANGGLINVNISVIE